MSEPNPSPPPTWAANLKRFDKAWTSFEAKLCAVILVLEIVALCIWIVLKNMPITYNPDGGGSKAGLVLRALLGGIALATVAHKVMGVAIKRDPAAQTVGPVHGAVVTTALVIGLALGKSWASTGADFFANIYSWLQSSSSLVMFNGLRGFSSRMTLLVALLGASIATAKAKHINVDFAMRALPERFRLPAAVMGWTAAAAVCVMSAYAFFDFIAIGNFQAPSKIECTDGTKGPEGTGLCDPPFSTKWEKVMSTTKKDLFVARRQIALDVTTFGRVMKGEKFSEMPAADWNAWLDAADWAAYTDAEELASFHATDGSPREPKAPVPGGGDLKLLLVKEFNVFVLGLGFILIAVRFLIRATLALAGAVSVDPDAAHASGDDDDDHDRSSDLLDAAAHAEEGAA
jgi:TRAP-type C4-dicarboxylate transport system permease small subunit